MSPQIELVAKKIKAYYRRPGNGGGGLCHNVLDDGNIECVFSCMEDCQKAGDRSGFRLMKTLTEMSETDRWKSVMLAHGEEFDEDDEY